MDADLVLSLCEEDIAFTFLRPMDGMFTPGTRADDAYVLARGILTYTQDPTSSPVDEPVTTVVREHQWLSEVALWTAWVHVGLAVADAFCEVVVIHAEGTIEAL